MRNAEFQTFDLHNNVEFKPQMKRRVEIVEYG